ncbi:MAG: tetratricopeptide repeat protein [Bacteroidetes bacterium]|nr:tetratricopeptide repeat protein [Bacteroidota bacterium]
MKKLLAILFILLITTTYGQVDLTDKFRELFNENSYDEIIRYKPKKDEELTAKALYYIGMSYYMKTQDNAAMKYIDMAIEKGPVDWDMFYYKGMLLFYADKFEESLPYFDKAIVMLPDETDFYAGKGEAYYSMENRDSAIVYFEKAAKLENCEPRVLLFMGEIYQYQNKIENALTAYKTALPQLTPNDDSHQNCSFNVGLMQQLTEKFPEARETFEKHISLYPTDFHAMAKLIQVYYSLTEFDKAIPYKNILYAAHKSDKLKEGMKEMFCFDQFLWNDMRVMAFENFDETGDFMFVKHHFYILDNNADILYRIDSESSPAISINDPNSKYVLCLVKDESHFTYWQYVFNDDYKYPELKAAVLDILNDKVKPSASFIPGEKNH